MTTKTRLTLQDFGVGLLAGLHEHGIHIIDDRDEQRLHECFLEAFKIVEKRLGKENLRFVIILNQFHGTSGDVLQIFSYWQGNLATLDSPGTTWRSRMTDQWAERLFFELPGGRELYVEAANAFMKHRLGY